MLEILIPAIRSFSQTLSILMSLNIPLMFFLACPSLNIQTVIFTQFSLGIKTSRLLTIKVKNKLDLHFSDQKISIVYLIQDYKVFQQSMYMVEMFAGEECW